MLFFSNALFVTEHIVLGIILGILLLIMPFPNFPTEMVKYACWCDEKLRHGENRNEIVVLNNMQLKECQITVASLSYINLCTFSLWGVLLHEPM